MTVFIRVNDAAPEAKPTVLLERVVGFRSSGPNTAVAFTADVLEFSAIPGSPFAYWVGPDIWRIFRELPHLEGSVATVKQGLATADDFRFVRAWWEVDPWRIGFSAENTERGQGWVHFVKGGSYSPYYADVHLVADWSKRGKAMKQYVVQRYPYIKGKASWVVKNEEYYFRPGLTWPRRTDGLSFRPMPVGGAFADKGPAVLAQNDDDDCLLGLLSILNSRMAERLINTQVARVELAQSFEVGLIANTPVPKALPGELAQLSRSAHDNRREAATDDERSHVFRANVPPGSKGLNAWIDERVTAVQVSQMKFVQIQAAIDQLVSKAYGVWDESLADRDLLVAGASDAQAGDVSSPSNGDEEDEQAASVGDSAPELIGALVAWSLGTKFGRWDVRISQDASLVPALQGPFERLPVVAPAGLVGPDGLPARQERIASEAWLRARPNVITLPEQGTFEGPASIPAEEYPIEVAWDGILVDDPGHPKDIVTKIREVLRYVYGDRAEAIEEEALTLLRGEGSRPASLRDWFREQKATTLGKTFFEFHIQGYSKSRRKAPIYWRLCSNPGRNSRYSVWLYYHRLTDDTLWRVLNEYVEPKRRLEERRVADLRGRLAGMSGSEARRLEAEVAEAEELVEELAGFAGRVRVVAERGYAPDRDDGVIINLAPLNEVVPWAEPKKVWEELEAGEYDWAKLAMQWWPERVTEKCRTDKSFAIAHGREDLYEEKTDDAD